MAGLKNMTVLAVGVMLALPSAVVAGVPALKPSVEASDAVIQIRRGGPVVVHRHYGRRHFYRPPILLYTAPVVTYGGHCAYLRHKARSTGSAYWWRRFRYEC